MADGYIHAYMSIRHSGIRVYFTITITSIKKSVYLNAFECASTLIAPGDNHV